MARAPLAHLDTLVFDMDGTLFDSRPLALKVMPEAFRRVAREIGADPAAPPPPARILGAVGLPSEAYYRALLPQAASGGWPLLQEAAAALERQEVLAGGYHLFPGVEAGLARLAAAGIRMALATNCGPTYMEAVVEHFGLSRFLERCFCLGQRDWDKAAMVGEAVRLFGTRRGAVVGDRSHDIEAARAHGLVAVAATWGFARPQELAAADYRIARFDDLLLLMGLAGG